MTTILTRAALAIAGSALAIGLAAGVAHAEPINPNPAPSGGHGCTLYNGKTMKDGQKYTTSNGTVITCIDGFVCRTYPSKGPSHDSCRIESGTLSPA